jgi:short-subunit dehydrogenase
MKRPDFEGARCLVTGASSGLGRAIATALLHRGGSVLGTGRNAARLDAWRQSCLSAGVRPERLATEIADLTLGIERARLVEQTAAWFDGTLDLLVHCAGVGAYGQFLSHEPDILRNLLEINVLATAELLRSVHPLLARGRTPALAVMGSIVSRRGLPGRSEYSASKFAVAGLIESLRAEWHRHGIHILLVNPGFTRTDFERHLLIDTALLNTQRRRTMSPERVAGATLRGLLRRKHEIRLSADGRLLLFANRVFPGLVDWGMARWTTRLLERGGNAQSGDTPNRTGRVGRTASST